MKTIRIKRIYEPASDNDGYRILVDRLWPRGISKAKAKIDLWLKEIAPSNQLRQWFHHEPEKWSEFIKLYHKELSDKQDLINIILTKSKETPITLLFSAKDENHNNAMVLRGYLKQHDALKKK